MTDDELDTLLCETERAIALGAIADLIALCERAELERALTDGSELHTAATEHSAQFGHRLTHGCCLRAHEHGLPSLID